MKLKAIATSLTAAFILVACQGMDTNDESLRDRDNQNIEQTRFNEKDRNFNRMSDRTRENMIEKDHISNRNKTDINQRNSHDRYDIADEAADKITDKIAEIDHAYVLKTKNNAYVAAVLDNDNTKSNTKHGDELTDDVKKEISDIVKSVDKDIDNVFVTTNPDFADLTNDYVNDMNNGKPIRGFFDQIGNMIERVFPQDKR